MNEYRIYGVCGNPVLHSKSPDIFNALFSKYNIPASYIRLAATCSTDIRFFVSHLKIHGLNITSPFKKEIMDLIDDISGDAKEIDAVNTVLNIGKLLGYNTDYHAVREIIRRNKIDLSGKNILVIGAGNAAKSAVYALKGNNITIINRTNARTDSLAEKFNTARSDWENLSDAAKTADIIISAINAKKEILNLEKSKAIIIDAIYNNSPLKKAAISNGNQYIPGEEWLIYQAIPAFKLFTGLTVSPDEIYPSLNQACNKPKNIILSGFMGAGKSTVAEIISNKNNFSFIDSDTLIEKASGMAIGDIFNIHGEEYFRDMETKILLEIKDIAVNSSQPSVISVGGGAVTRPDNKDILKSMGYNFWLLSDPETMFQRTLNSGRPLLQNKNKNEALELYHNRIKAYSEFCDAVIFNNMADDTAARIIQELSAIE